MLGGGGGLGTQSDKHMEVVYDTDLSAPQGELRKIWFPKNM
jgi:hypothetical protein